MTSLALLDPPRSSVTKRLEAPFDTTGALAQFTDRLLRRQTGTELILRELEQNPGDPALTNAAAAFHLLSDTRAGINSARALLGGVHYSGARANNPERLFTEALRALASDRALLASRLFRSLAIEAPDHLLAAYVGHLHFLNAGHISLMLEHSGGLTRLMPRDPFVLGMRAFALEEVGDNDAAVQYAEAAQRIDPSIAWVHHAFAHILRNQGRQGEAISWMRAQVPHWASCSDSMLTHLWWHVQLMLLDTGDCSGALALYDEILAPRIPESVGAYVNAVSFLARLAFREYDVGSRWQGLADHAQTLMHDHVLGFIDLHHALALRYADRSSALDELCLELRRRTIQAPQGPDYNAWLLGALPIADALAAAMHGHRARAEGLMQRSRPHVLTLGGSAQQRAVFAELDRSISGRALIPAGERP